MLKLVELVDNKYVWRCEKCGWESKNMTKREAIESPPPAHRCPRKEYSAKPQTPPTGTFRAPDVAHATLPMFRLLASLLCINPLPSTSPGGMNCVSQTRRVDISINGFVVGHAVFALN